ncbi:MAG: heavy metal translocating P-type ATPase [Armatimonadota bacterium]
MNASDRPCAAGAGFCEHCGLLLGARRCSPDGRREFCCYGCYLVHRIVGPQGERGVASAVLTRLGVGALLAMNVMMVSLLLYSDALADIGPEARAAFRWALLGLSTPVLVILGVPFAAGALGELRRGSVSTDSLIALGVFSAFGVSATNVIRGHGHIYFDTAAMLLVLLTLGRLLEATAKTRSARVVRGLLELAAPQARVLTADGEQQVRPEEVSPGQRVRVKPGERIPVDGRVVAGRTTVEEAAFTGESVPRVCAAGDVVYGGSVSADGEVAIEAERVGEGTLLAQMARLVRQAEQRRAPIERLVNRMASVFVVVVVLAALGCLAYWHLARGDAAKGAMSALAILVVACPCALGLAMPLVTSMGVGRAARAGVLIRSGEALEQLARITRMFVDKTGTLTRGSMAVGEVSCLGKGCTSPRQALSWVASLENASEHPIARAVVAAASEAQVSVGTVRGFRASPGEGAAGRVALDGVEREVAVGTAAFMSRRGVGHPDPAAARGATVVYAAWDGEVQAAITLSDAVRPEAPAAVAQLEGAGVAISILSGDRGSAVRELAEQLRLDDVRGDCTPDMKIAAICRAREAGEVVGMVGDGINDAPALAEADLGIAMSGGTELAKEASDVTLRGDDLRRLPWVLALSRRAYSLIRQNLLWAFGYNLVMMTIAFFGYLHPLLAALLMLGSSFFVLGNSLKLARHPNPPSAA